MANGIVTLSDLITLVRQEANMENTQFVTDSELTTYISNSYKELYDLLIGAYGEDYYVATPVNITTTTSTTYPLPNGTLYSAAPSFYKLLGVDYQTSANDPNGYVTLRTFAFGDRNKFSTPNFVAFNGYINLRYRLQGNNLYLSPTPTSGQTIRVWYIPRPTTLATGADTVDGVSGWEEYIVIDAAIKCLNKEESDVTVLMARKAAMKARIEGMAANRDAGNPGRTVDIYGGEYGDEGGGGYG